jgi:hypothetical protein
VRGAGSTTRDGVRRAYATLGLPFGASPAQLKRRYRALVKTWHPDRFASDPAGQAAACDRLTHINNAYRLLIGNRPSSAGAGASTPRPEPSATARSSPGARLTREQIDAMVRAIGNESPVDWLLGSFEEHAWPSGRAALAGARPASIAAGVVVALGVIAVDLWMGRWAGSLIVGLGFVAAALSRTDRSRTARG